MNRPKEPDCPAGRKPHKDRVREIDLLLQEGQTGGIVIDNTPGHIEWYLHEIATKYPRLVVEYKGRLSGEMYIIRVKKVGNN